MKTFFSVFNENQQIPISEVLMTSKIIVHDLNSTCYVFLGDPALKLSDSRIDLNLTRDNSNLYFSCRSSHMTITSGNFDVRIYKRDSVSMGSSHYCLDSLVSRQTGTFSNGTFSAALTDTNVRVVAYVWNELGEGRMDSSFLLFTIPVVVQVNQKIDAPMLKIVSGKLILKAASLRNTLIRITALTLNGRSVINKEISMSTPEITVDPKGMGLAAGTYLIKLSTVNGIFIQRMTISK
ncbi:MAG TPA: hypothetical protein DCO75_11435 [Fibrobacteres bacterium]|nr:hypothetical protein [Fibrobacterota bacterium]